MTVLTNRSQSLIQVERKDRINPCGKNREMKYTVFDPTQQETFYSINQLREGEK